MPGRREDKECSIAWACLAPCQDLYEVLGLAEDADEASIKKAEHPGACLVDGSLHVLVTDADPHTAFAMT